MQWPYGWCSRHCTRGSCVWYLTLHSATSLKLLPNRVPGASLVVGYHWKLVSSNDSQDCNAGILVWYWYISSVFGSCQEYFLLVLFIRICPWYFSSVAVVNMSCDHLSWTVVTLTARACPYSIIAPPFHIFRTLRVRHTLKRCCITRATMRCRSTESLMLCGTMAVKSWLLHSSHRYEAGVLQYTNHVGWLGSGSTVWKRWGFLAAQFAYVEQVRGSGPKR